MTGSATTIAASMVLPVAIVVGPYLLARNVLPRATWPACLSATACFSVALNVFVPVLLHVQNIHIEPASLAALHAMPALALAAITILRRLPLLPPSDHDGAGVVPWLAAAFCLLVVPFTHLAGIDTYRWQDSATVVLVERNIPWLVHPISLFGFTPRAYSSAQPLMLATIQGLGGLGVDSGYYVMSLFSGLAGLTTAYLLGRRLFNEQRHACWMAALYVFSPVFMRYNHWATGRGLFLALVPLFVLLLLKWPRPAAILSSVGVALLLALCHRTGMIAIILIPLAFILSLLVPRRGQHVTLPALLALGLLAGVLLSPPVLLPAPAGALPGAAVKLATRFGVLVPLAVAGVVSAVRRGTMRNARAILPALAVSLPLSFSFDMYGALITTVFLAAAATAGIATTERLQGARGDVIRRAAAALLLAGAIVIVGHRSLTATPSRVREAARHLQQTDPDGPFRIEAPEAVRTKMQAYVTGCPRFVASIEKDSELRLRTDWPRWPSDAGGMREWHLAWVTFARHLLRVSYASAPSYGNAGRVYYVVVDGRGRRPPETEKIYERNGIEIYCADPSGAQSESARIQLQGNDSS